MGQRPMVGDLTGRAEPMLGCSSFNPRRAQKPSMARLYRDATAGYFSRRQLIEPRFSTVLDSTSTSNPRRSRYFSVITEPAPTSDTP